MTISERLDHPPLEGEHLGLAINRESYKIDQHRVIEVRVGVVQPDMPGSPVEPWFQCITCDYLLFYFDDRGVFECGECGYSMSKVEAVDLCAAHIEHVKELSKSFMSTPAADGDLDVDANTVENFSKKKWYFLWLW